MEQAITLSWVVLYATGYLALHAVCERLLYHGARRAADPVALRSEAARWRRAGAVCPPAAAARLGWLWPLLRGTAGDGPALLAACVREQGQMVRFRDVLPMAGNVATATGLLASVLALHQTAHAQDPNAVIALGMVATIVGLTIAIPVTIFNGLFTARTERLAEQADEVIAALEDVLFRPAVPTAGGRVAAGENGAPPGKRQGRPRLVLPRKPIAQQPSRDGEVGGENGRPRSEGGTTAEGRAE